VTVVSPTSTEEDTEWPAMAALNADDEAEAAAEEPEAAAEIDRAELEAARDARRNSASAWLANSNTSYSHEPVAWLTTDEAADSADAVLLIPAPESALAAADDNPLMLVVSPVAAEMRLEISAVPPEASEAAAEVISEATAVSVPAWVSVARAVAVAVPATAVSVPATAVSVPTTVSVATAVVSWRLTLAA
jgi:hypothetical protein